MFQPTLYTRTTPSLFFYWPPFFCLCAPHARRHLRWRHANSRVAHTRFACLDLVSHLGPLRLCFCPQSDAQIGLLGLKVLSSPTLTFLTKPAPNNNTHNVFFYTGHVC